MIFACYNPSVREREVRVSANDTEMRFLFRRPGRNEEVSAGIFWNAQVFSRAVYLYPPSRRFLVLSETPIKPYFARIDQELPLARHGFSHVRELSKRFEHFSFIPFGTSFVGSSVEVQAKDRLVSFVGSVLHHNWGGYNLRKQVANFCLTARGVDCFGRGIREIENKSDGLARYRFSIAMENTLSDCYFTEKLVDCFMTATVPIYWGTRSVEEIFDPRGIIFFNTLNELREILENLSIRRYEEMAPFVRANRDRAVTLRLASYEDFLSRVGEQVLPFVSSLAPISVLGRNKIMALFRSVRERTLVSKGAVHASKAPGARARG